MRRLLKDPGGATAIEFGLIFPFFLLIVVAIMEFGTYMMVRNNIQYAAEEAARIGMINTAMPTADVAAVARSRLAQLGDYPPARLTVTVTEETVGGTRYIVVATAYDWAQDAFTGFFPEGLRTATGRARMPRVE